MQVVSAIPLAIKT